MDPDGSPVQRGAASGGLQPLENRLELLALGFFSEEEVRGLAGILLMKLAKARGAKTIIACDIDNSRLDAAKRAGADLTISAHDDVVNIIKQNHDGRLVDKVLICAGALSAAETALQRTRSGQQIDRRFAGYIQLLRTDDLRRVQQGLRCILADEGTAIRSQYAVLG